jgi:acyl-CoA synthetase (AMP-forming)/AMP-acid ligase II
MVSSKLVTFPVRWTSERALHHHRGRSKDLIISGGYNVYPAEIEVIVQRHARRRKARWSVRRT